MHEVKRHLFLKRCLLTIRIQVLMVCYKNGEITTLVFIFIGFNIKEFIFGFLESLSKFMTDPSLTYKPH